MIWTAYSIAAACGSCPTVIPAGGPVAVFNGKQRRCTECAERLGYFVDQAAVDAALQAIADKENAPKPVSESTRRREEGFVALIDIEPAKPVTSQPIPFHELPASARRAPQQASPETTNPQRSPHDCHEVLCPRS